MKHLTVAALSLSTATATAAHGQESASDSAIEAIRSVSPALKAYTTDDLYGDVWQRARTCPRGTGASSPWHRSSPAIEQARILRLLVERIDVVPDGVSVTLHAAGIRSLVAELAGQRAFASAASESLLKT
jgi:hypothetical protein